MVQSCSSLQCRELDLQEILDLIRLQDRMSPPPPPAPAPGGEEKISMEDQQEEKKPKTAGAKKTTKKETTDRKLHQYTKCPVRI